MQQWAQKLAAMGALGYLLPRPSFDLTPGMRAAFEHLYGATPRGGLVDYHLPYPKWCYLSYLCESRELVLHGSQDRDIGGSGDEQTHVDPVHGRSSERLHIGGRSYEVGVCQPQ